MNDVCWAVKVSLCQSALADCQRRVQLEKIDYVEWAGVVSLPRETEGKQVQRGIGAGIEGASRCQQGEGQRGGHRGRSRGQRTKTRLSCASVPLFGVAPS